MIWASILLVAGALGLIGVSITSYAPDVELGAGLVIQGRVPWLLLLVL